MLKKTNSKYFKWAACALAIVGFFMIFAPQLYLFFGLGDKTYLHAGEVFFGKGDFGVNFAGGFVGYLMILLGGLGIGALGCVLQNDAKLNVLLNVIAILIVFIGAILVFCTKTFFISHFEGYTSSFHFAAGPILGGIFGLLAGITSVFSISLDLLAKD